MTFTGRGRRRSHRRLDQFLAKTPTARAPKPAGHPKTGGARRTAVARKRATACGGPRLDLERAPPKPTTTNGPIPEPALPLLVCTSDDALLGPSTSRRACRPIPYAAGEPAGRSPRRWWRATPMPLVTDDSARSRVAHRLDIDTSA